jgi:hypothetical protein
VYRKSFCQSSGKGDKLLASAFSDGFRTRSAADKAIGNHKENQPRSQQMPKWGPYYYARFPCVAVKRLLSRVEVRCESELEIRNLNLKPWSPVQGV